MCNVSTSFIRDAESNPGRCTVEKLLQLTQGLGLQLTISGLQNDMQANRQEITSTESPAA